MKLSKKSLKFGSLATAMSALFIAIIVIVNAAAVWLVDSFPVKLDLTEEGLYQLSDETVKYINSIEEQVRIICLLPEPDVNVQINEVVKNFSRLSNGKISVEYVDIYKDPEFAQKYSKEGQLTKNSLIVESSRRFKIVSATSLYDWSYNSYGQIAAAAFKADQVITSAIMYVLSSDLPKAYFVKGHNEYDPVKMKEIFTSNNYSAEDINLTQANIENDAVAVVIAAPTRDFSPDEIEKIDAYVQNGGNLMVFMDPSQPALPTLESYIAEWGVKVGDNRKVCDEERSKSGDVTQIVPVYQGTGFTDNIDSKLITVMPATRRLEKIFELKDARKVETVLLSSAKSYVKQNPQSELVLFEEGDIRGPFIVATNTTKTRYEENKPIVSRVFVCGSTAMISDDALNAPNLANADIIANAIPIFRGDKGNTFVVRPKRIGERTLDLTITEATVVSIVFVVAVPLAALLFGLVVWLRRRHL